MSTESQSNYITDLAVRKTKEFKEVKEMLVASGIVSDQAELVAGAQSMAEITHALSDKQASQFIDLLTATKAPERARVYARKRVERTIAALDDIKAEIDDWGF